MSNHLYVVVLTRFFNKQEVCNNLRAFSQREGAVAFLHEVQGKIDATNARSQDPIEFALEIETLLLDDFTEANMDWVFTGMSPEEMRLYGWEKYVGDWDAYEINT